MVGSVCPRPRRRIEIAYDKENDGIFIDYFQGSRLIVRGWEPFDPPGIAHACSCLTQFVEEANRGIYT